MQSYKKFKMASFLALLCLMSVQNVEASLLVEPHLSYNLSGSGDNNQNPMTEYDYNGAQMGMRLGYQSLGLMAGVDFTRSSYDLDYKTSGGTVTGEVDRSEFGVFVGYNLPIMFRAWGAYYFSNSTKDKTFNTKKTGDTKELGFGFTGLPFVSLNLMYRMISLDENTASNGVKSSIDHSHKEFVVGVSLPLTL